MGNLRSVWRRRVGVLLLATTLLGAGAAEAYTLEALLRLPFERLLELRITARSPSPAIDRSRDGR